MSITCMPEDDGDNEMQEHPLLQTLMDPLSRLREEARVVAHAAEYAQDLGRVDGAGVILQAPPFGRIAHVHAEHPGPPAERALGG